MLRNLAVCRHVSVRLLLFCSPSLEREPDLIAHSALGRVAVQALEETATVGVAELVRDEVRRESALAAAHLPIAGCCRTDSPAALAAGD
jgi:hypothetical protein